MNLEKFREICNANCGVQTRFREEIRKTNEEMKAEAREIDDWDTEYDPEYPEEWL